MTAGCKNIIPTRPVYENTVQSFLYRKSFLLCFTFLFLISFGAEVEAQCPTIITTQPASQTVCSGGSVTFTVTTDATPDSYHWYLNGTEIVIQPASSNSTTFTINPVTPSDLGNYHVEILKSGCTNVVSSIATLSFYSALDPGSINTTGGSFCVGGNANIGGTSSPYGPATGGSPSYTYVWQESIGCTGTWTDITGANGTSYDPPAFASAGTYCYRRKVTDGCGTIAFTGFATFNVYADPISQTINPTPVSTSVCSGINISATDRKSVV